MGQRHSKCTIIFYVGCLIFRRCSKYTMEIHDEETMGKPWASGGGPFKAAITNSQLLCGGDGGWPNTTTSSTGLGLWPRKCGLLVIATRRGLLRSRHIGCSCFLCFWCLLCQNEWGYWFLLLQWCCYHYHREPKYWRFQNSSITLCLNCLTWFYMLIWNMFVFYICIYRFRILCLSRIIWVTFFDPHPHTHTHTFSISQLFVCLLSHDPSFL